MPAMALERYSLVNFFLKSSLSSPCEGVIRSHLLLQTYQSLSARSTRRPSLGSRYRQNYGCLAKSLIPWVRNCRRHCSWTSIALGLPHLRKRSIRLKTLILVTLTRLILLTLMSMALTSMALILVLRSPRRNPSAWPLSKRKPSMTPSCGALRRSIWAPTPTARHVALLQLNGLVSLSYRSESRKRKSPSSRFSRIRPRLRRIWRQTMLLPSTQFRWRT